MKLFIIIGPTQFLEHLSYQITATFFQFGTELQEPRRGAFHPDLLACDGHDGVELV